MGGYGSGSWMRFHTKPVVENGLTLDLNRLLRDKLVLPGQHVSGTITWTRTSNGQRTASIGFEANLQNHEAAWIRLQYTADGTPVDYFVHLTTTRPHFGGYRWWFSCPTTGTRAAKLYLPAGERRFASRHAYRLAYHSQNQTFMDRNLSRAQDIRRRLGGSPSLFEPFPWKPNGMHWKTYWRLRERAERASRASTMAMARRLGMTL